VKFEKLNIYGFGKHENMTIEFGPSMNVLYGLNEAGKTTIQQFILHILFGFPQRNSTILRYEPKSGGRYGGQIVLNDTKYGRCVIERVQGKSAGDVTVYFEDGLTGNEEALSMILGQYDRTSFKSIFSFSLLQLQGFEKMDEEELSRTLLASGTTGVESLLQLEKRLEKERGDLFKKSGKNPEMNLKMKELRAIELELKEEQAKVEQYGPSIERIQKVDERLALLQESENEIKKSIQQYSRLRQYLPLYKKKEEIESRLKEMGVIKFPADGIRRFESLMGKLAETKATKRRIANELSEINSDPASEQLSERIAEVERLLAKEAEWHGWRAKLVSIESELKRLDGSQYRLFDRLGIQLDQKTVLFDADVSIRKEEEMHELIQETTRINQEIDFISSQLEVVKDELKSIDSNIKVLQIPTINEIENAREWPTIRQQLAEARAYMSFGENPNVQSSKLISLVLMFLSLALIGFGLIHQQWFIVLMGAVVGGIGLSFYLKKKPSIDSKMEKMKAIIAAYSEQEADMEWLVRYVDDYRRDKARYEEELHNQRIKYGNFETKINKLEENRVEATERFERFIKGYGFDGFPSMAIVPELFRMIREVQEVTREIKDLKEQKSVIERAVEERISDAENTLQQIVPTEILYEVLRKEYLRMHEAQERLKSLEERKSSLVITLKEVALLEEAQQSNLSELLSAADVETEDAFYRRYDTYQEGIRYKDQLTDVVQQLETGQAFISTVDITDDELVLEVSGMETELRSINEELTRLINEKAALANKTEQLLTDETYGVKLQIFEMKKAELAELAKKWATRTAVTEAIKQTMLELKEKKLPQVLSQAEILFKKLTGGKYEALVVTEAGFFIAVANNGLRYPIAELSQATKEQAYISLRFALASSVLDTAPFPIMMDDPFVHFDEERLSSMIEVLSATNDHQFLYFTCHKKMRDKWTDAVIINV